MRIIHLVFALALPLGALLCGINAAAAGGDTPDARTACTPDAFRLCSDFIPDADKVKACMLRKRSQLSDGCRTAMAGGPRRHREASYHHRRHYRRRHCRHHDCG